MAKKLESSQATAKHMRQVTKEPQATQVNLLRHQMTELPPSKFQRKQNKKYRSRQAANKHYQEDKYKEECLRQMEDFIKIHRNTKEDLIMSIQGQIDVPNVVTLSIEKGSGVQQASTNARFAINLATSVACATRKMINMKITKGPLVHPRHIK